MIFDHIQPEDVIKTVTEKGYCFIDEFLTAEGIRSLRDESDDLDFQFQDSVTHPIWKGSRNEVRQKHSRSYHMISSGNVPAASLLSQECSQLFPINGWLMTEAGYQRYRSDSDFISPHRDRRSDHLMSVTVTLAGSALVRILIPNSDHSDYTDLSVLDQFMTKPGSAMILRAPGLGSGEQVIHEVFPPESGSRLILNLRMRDSVLRQLNEEIKCNLQTC